MTFKFSNTDEGVVVQRKLLEVVSESHERYTDEESSLTNRPRMKKAQAEKCRYARL